MKTRWLGNWLPRNENVVTGEPLLTSIVPSIACQMNFEVRSWTSWNAGSAAACGRPVPNQENVTELPPVALTATGVVTSGGGWSGPSVPTSVSSAEGTAARIFLGDLGYLTPLSPPLQGAADAERVGDREQSQARAPHRCI